MLPPEQQLAPTEETVLTGGSGTLDSLSLVNFIVTFEGKAHEVFGLSLNLAEEIAALNGPLSSLGSLVDYVENKIEGGM